MLLHFLYILLIAVYIRKINWARWDVSQRYDEYCPGFKKWENSSYQTRFISVNLHAKALVCRIIFNWEPHFSVKKFKMVHSSKIVNSVLISLLMSLIQGRRYIEICQIKIYQCFWNPPRWNNSTKFVFLRKNHPNKLRSHLRSGDISSRWDVVPCWFCSYINSL